MKKKININTTIYNIVNNALNTHKISIYSIKKQTKLSEKTIEKMLKDNSSNFTKNSIRKLLLLKTISKEEKKNLIDYISEREKKKAEDKKFLNILKNYNDLLLENEILKENLKVISIENDTKKYFSNRKVSAFESDLHTNSLLITKIWEFNSEILKQWADIKLLLDINKIEKTLKMKKGLKSLASNLSDISDYLECIYFDKNDLQPEEVITIYDEEEKNWK